ncbi:hypothetical protein D043_2710A, partial [Vibrio parahaemolyticus EKP-021]
MRSSYRYRPDPIHS